MSLFVPNYHTSRRILAKFNQCFNTSENSVRLYATDIHDDKREMQFFVRKSFKFDRKWKRAQESRLFHQRVRYVCRRMPATIVYIDTILHHFMRYALLKDLLTLSEYTTRYLFIKLTLDGGKWHNPRPRSTRI